jgi:chromosome segregation ATPase
VENNGKTLQDLVKDVASIKADNKASEQVHMRLDEAISKLTDISSSLKSMLAVQEEKIRRVDMSQEDLMSLMEQRRREWNEDLENLHSRISTQSRELREALDKLDRRLDERVGVLEKWRWLIIGGAILVGFLMQKMEFSLF